MPDDIKAIINYESGLYLMSTKSLNVTMLLPQTSLSQFFM